MPAALEDGRLRPSFGAGPTDGNGATNVLSVVPTRKGSGTPDEALLARVAEGDRDEALVELYRRYARRLYGLGRRLLPERGMAEELVQDTFVRLWRSAGRFDPDRGSAQTFVFTLARRAAVDLLRRSATRPLTSPDTDDLPSALVSEADFAQLLSALEVRDALCVLPDKHREVLELLYDDDLTQREVATRLDLPLGTVKTRAFYALRALKAELEERDVLA